MIMPGRNEPGEGVYEFIILYQVNYYTTIILFLVSSRRKNAKLPLGAI